MTSFALKMFMVVLKTVRNICFLLVLFLSFVQHGYAHDEFIKVIAESKPSVVTLEVTRKKGKKNSRQIIDALGESAEFFEEGLNGLPRKSRGSGFIISVSGSHNDRNTILILTAAHVVYSAINLKVFFANGKRKNADIVWLNKKKDVALLKVTTKKPIDYAPLLLSSQQLVEGQSVLAIAAAFDLSVGSSLGIISAINVQLTNKKGVNLIQTDAAINPGSSGGPLLNSDGEVVGLISNIYTRTGTFSGAAFAIPAETISILLEKNKKIK